MKRRLALLLALSLTFASLPATGAAAADITSTAGTEVVTEVEQEETSGDAASIETVIVDSADEGKEESAVEAVSTSQETSQEQETEVPAEATVNEETEDAATEGVTNEAAVEGVTDTVADTEKAAEVEPATPADLIVDKVEDQSFEAKWSQTGNKWYYYDESGNMVTGWLPLNGKTYYLGTDGAMLTGWQKIDGNWYYFAAAPSGAMQTGWQKINNHWYYLGTDGVMVTGWQDIGVRRYYFNDGGSMFQGWLLKDGKYYYLSKAENSGAMQTGWQYIGVKWYYFDNEGVMQTGWQEIDNDWYYFNAGGSMFQGWFLSKGNYFYLSKETGAMLTGWQKIGSKWYYFKPDGIMHKGLQHIGIRWYYFASGGAMQTGWVKQNGVWSYYQDGGAALSERWKQKGDDWLYLNDTGVAKTGWFKPGDYWYYLNPSTGGLMLNKPTVLGVNLYFFYENGILASTKGWKTNGGNMYYTNEKGVCYRNTTIDGIKIDKNGIAENPMDVKAQGYSSNTNYLILVDKTTYTVCVYKGSKGNWTRVKKWYCTHGGSDTPNGSWVIDDHVTKRSAVYGWADFDYSSAAFAVHISAGNYFHSVLYEKYTRGNPYTQDIMDPALKQSYSHGCIRLETENAEWIWDNIPFGTKVVVYNS